MFRTGRVVLIGLSVGLGVRVAPELVAHEPSAEAGDPADVVLVEPEVREAFDRALARYPERIRKRLGHTGLRRERTYGVPEDAPLMARLMGDAVYAYYSMGTDSVTLLDAGLAERAAWTGGDAGEAEVTGLLDDLGLLGDDRDVSGAWAAFVRTVQGWPGAPPIEGDVRFGDGRVLDRFVRLGVGRALARDWERVGSLDLEQQMVHELAHAVQLDGRALEGSDRMYAWGTLSGWIRADDGKPFDGFYAGTVRTEDPAVLGRLLVVGERGEGIYAHSPSARFVNRYARYDAREDYAESVRLFMEDPAQLLRIDPTKFMYINALGFNASLDLSEPGPLWIDAERIRWSGWREAVQRGAAELLVGREGIDVEPRTVAALVRAHAELLEPAGLPERDVFRSSPVDAPEAISRALDPDDFSARIGDRRFGPPVERVNGLLETSIIAWHDDDAFWRSIEAMVEPSAGDVEDEFAGLAEIDDPQARALAAARLIAKAERTVGERCAAEMMAREVRAMRRAERPLLAETLKLRYALADGGNVTTGLLEQWEEIALEAGDVYGSIELRRGLVDLFLQQDDPARAVAMARSIGGASWGLVRRTDAYCAIAQATSDVSILDEARPSLANRDPGKLTKYLASMISDVRAAIAGNEEGE